tara:strand:+ start:1586 stop:2347 length:762 start_codon:yes stop_codon:yes gene_type:complete
VNELEADVQSGPVGLDTQRSVLYAQVMDGKPRMSINSDGFLQVDGSKGAAGKVYLGDVAQAALRSMGTHESPRFIREPGYDEQRWELLCRSNDLTMTISSRHYWGFGLWGRCFLNEIVIEGPLPVRARCVLDIVATLGRNPWEATRVKSFEKATSGTMSSHTSSWEGLVSLAKESMHEEITQLQDAVRSLRGVSGDTEELLDAAEQALDEARSALSDKNAPAVERALSRASNAIIQADLNTEVRSADQTLMGD